MRTFIDDAFYQQFMTEAIRQPVLKIEKQFELGRRIKENQDPEAVALLASCYMRMVGKFARIYKSYGLPISELLSAGNVGLVEAVKRYDPDLGFAFATHAQWWIRAAIQEYILHNWSLVKMGTTAAQKKLFFNLRKIKANLNVAGEDALSPENATRIAKQLGVKAKDVLSMNGRLTQPDGSLNEINPNLDPRHKHERIEELVDESDSQEAIIADRDEMSWRRMLLHKAMVEVFDPSKSSFALRDKDIFVSRFLMNDEITLENLATKYKISRERVRQIQDRAFEKIQKRIEALLFEAHVETIKARQALGTSISLDRSRQGADAPIKMLERPGFKKTGTRAHNEIGPA